MIVKTRHILSAILVCGIIAAVSVKSREWETPLSILAASLDPVKA